MPITVNWDTDEHVVVIVAPQGRWSLDEFYESFDQLETMVRGVPHQVVVIMEMSQSVAPAGSFLSTNRYMRAKTMPNIERVIFIRTNSFMKVMINIMSTLLPARKAKLTYAENLDEAREMAYGFLQAAAAVE